MNFKHVGASISAATLGTVVPAIALAQAAGTNPFQRGIRDVGNVGTSAGITSTANIYQIAGSIINIVLGFLGIVLLGYMLYAGFLWMTSGGSDDKAGEAKTMIKNAVIGLIIIVAAFSISNFVLGSLVNVSQGTAV